MRTFRKSSMVHNQTILYNWGHTWKIPWWQGMSHDVLFVSLKELVIPDEFMGIGHHLWYNEDVIDVSVSYK